MAESPDRAQQLTFQFVVQRQPTLQRRLERRWRAARRNYHLPSQRERFESRQKPALDYKQAEIIWTLISWILQRSTVPTAVNVLVERRRYT